MEAMQLNDIRQALSREYSLEIDRIIRGETTDKTYSKDLKRIMDTLPRIEDGDRELVEEVVRRYRSKIRHQRLPYEYKVVEGVTRLKVVLFNDFHGTEVTVWPRVIRDETIMFPPEQVAECKETLCPDGRQCVGLLGERWRGSGYADVFKEDKDGNLYARAASFFLDPSELEEY